VKQLEGRFERNESNGFNQRFLEIVGSSCNRLNGAAPTRTLNGSGSDILEFFHQNHSGPETYTFDSIPSNLTLASDPAFNCNFTGMASVYLETNLDPGNVIGDAISSVLVDVPAP
jgi:hypothetical protein